MKRGVDRREKKSLNMNVGSETELPDFLVINGQKFHKNAKIRMFAREKLENWPKYL